MAAGGRLLGVTVEEALVRKSGLIDTIVNLEKETWQDLEKDGEILQGYLNKIDNLKINIQEYYKRQEKISEQALSMLKRESAKAKRLESFSEYRNLFQAHVGLTIENAEKEIQSVILATFKLEHKMLDKLTKNKTTTADYAIYFYSGDSNKEIKRGSISAEDLYNSNFITVSKKGAIMLKKDIIKAENVLQYAENTNSILNESMREDLEKIIQEAYSFFSDIQVQYDNLSATASKLHLGDKMDSEYDAAKSAVENTNRVIQERIAALTNWMFNNQRTKIPNSAMNRGHFVEAYERVRQSRNTDGIPQISYYQALKESFGDDPWYIGGDVNQTQVKSFFDGKDRRIASFDSIIKLGHTLISLVTSGKDALESIQKQGAQRIAQKEKLAAVDEEIESRTRKVLEDLINILKT